MSRLSAHTIDVVKGMAPAFRTYGVEIACRTYQLVLADPRASIIFDMTVFDATDRSRWFADLMIETVENIDDPGALSEVAVKMSERHLKEGITSAHYLWLSQAWPAAVRDVLGFGASDTVIDAWEEVYWYLASLLTAKKDELQYWPKMRKVA